MTTYTISGFKLSYSGNSISNITPMEFKVIAADAEESFHYTVTGKDPDSFFPYVELDGIEPYNVYFNGVSQEFIFDEDNDEDLAGYMSWGAGNAAYFIDFWDSDTNEDYIFQMGGTALPTFTSVAQLNTFYNSLSGGGEITSGLYAPGQEIRLDGFTNVVVTENDVIKGNSGADIFHGGLGRDKIFGGGGDDTLYGDGGRDKIFAGKGADKLFGGNFADKLFGAGNNDEINGGRGDDYLDGGAGRDRLNGGKGDDFHYGDAGRDTFVFTGAKNQGDDTIGDFQSGVDVIEIGGTVRFAKLTITAEGEDTLISWRKTTVTLLDTDASLIDRDDFSFV